MNPLDPDPRHVDPDRFFEGWREGVQHERSQRGVALLVTGVCAAIIGGVIAATILLAGHALARTSDAPGHGALDSGNGNQGGLSSEGSLKPVPMTGASPEPVVTVEDPPAPVTDIGTALESGLASWYRDPRKTGNYAAVPGWHFGDRPYAVTVCHGSRCVTVTVSDACGCPGDRIIDLAPSAFVRLAPLSRGIVSVTVESGGPLPTLPATSTK